MTNQTPQRRSLLPVRPVQPANLSEAAIADVANRNGFQAAPAPAADTASTSSGTQRRQRQPTGRDQQFTTRLKRETIDFIYAQANSLNVPIAQVIEDMAEARKRELQGA